MAKDSEENPTTPSRTHFRFMEDLGVYSIVNAGIQWNKWPVRGFVFSKDQKDGQHQEVYLPYEALISVENITYPNGVSLPEIRDKPEDPGNGNNGEEETPPPALEEPSPVWRVQYIT